MTYKLETGRKANFWRIFLDSHAISIMYDMKRSRYKLENIFALKICLTTFDKLVKKESAILLNSKKKSLYKR
jgi:hypothetical protein